MLTLLCCAALALALLFPNTQAGKVLRDLLIDRPARHLAKLTPVRIVISLILIAAVAGFIALAKTDGLIMVAQGFPDMIVWFAAFDVATYVDVIGLLLLMAATIRMRAAFRASWAVAARSWRWLMQGAKRLRLNRRRATERRRRPRRPVPPPSDGDDRGWCGPAHAWA